MKSIWIVPVIISILILGTFGLTQDALGTIHDVRIEGFAYNPEVINIFEGDTIRWTNFDATPHTVTEKNSEFGDACEVHPIV